MLTSSSRLLRTFTAAVLLPLLLAGALEWTSPLVDLLLGRETAVELAEAPAPAESDGEEEPISPRLPLLPLIGVSAAFARSRTTQIEFPQQAPFSQLIALALDAPPSLTGKPPSDFASPHNSYDPHILACPRAPPAA